MDNYTVKKWDGNGPADWAIFRKGLSRPLVSNLTRTGVEFYLTKLNNSSGKLSLSGIIFLLLGRVL